ncbi:MAG: porin family protein [Gemmatimonadota bacterium]|nr:porin family protein [Gemmatimonadota bacterium]
MKTRLILASAALALSSGAAGHRAGAQILGPQRQFIAIEPIYSRLGRDLGEPMGRTWSNGYGARLWINTAPFVGPGVGLGSKVGIGLFSVYSPPSHGISTVHYGAELDVHATDVPYGGYLDPFITVGGGVLRTKTGVNNDFSLPPQTVNKFALTPGVGVRIPLLNHLQARADARDVIVFSDQSGAGNAAIVNSTGTAATRTTHNLEFLVSIGVMF